MNKLFPQVETYIKNLPGNTPLTASRQEILREVVSYIHKKHQEDKVAELVFICSHNSRRSHLTQIWATIASHYHGLDNLLTFSGGTEATAFNGNAIAALERAGCVVEKPGGKNPVFLVKFSETHKGIQAFSKKYGDKYNPQKGFCAVMTCSEADDACPVVFGMDGRVSLKYVDPKSGDGLPNEAEVYDQRCAQIAIEMFYMIGQVNALKLR